MVKSRVPTALLYGSLGDLADPAPRLLAALGLQPHLVAPDDLIPRLRAQELRVALLAAPPSATVLSQIDRLAPESQASGLIDLLHLEGAEMIGRSTLVEGLVTLLERTGAGIAGRPTLVFGAGRRARAVAAGLALRGSPHVRFAARSLEQAIDAVSAVRPLVQGEGALLDLVPLASMPFEDEGWERALVVNATPIGLDDPDADPLWRFARLGRDMRVIDLVHRPMRTALLRRAHRSKGQYLVGMTVCAEQALKAAMRARGDAIPAAEADALRRLP